MENSLLTRLLENNDIPQDHFEEVSYKALLGGIFESICKQMKREGTRTEELTKFRKSNNHIDTTRKIVDKYTGCVLSNYEYEYIYTLLKAHFRKDDRRKVFPESYKNQLLEQQGWRCPLCGSRISINNSHLDHIIPWDFVGDELDDNYQMLCASCNERKGTSAFYEFMKILQHSNNRSGA